MHPWATLTKSGHNKICEVLRLGRLEILSASVSGGHRRGIVQTLSYTKIKGKEKDWKIQQFCLKPQEKYGGGTKYKNSPNITWMQQKEK